jgi:hypothetical protein
MPSHHTQLNAPTSTKAQNPLLRRIRPPAPYLLTHHLLLLHALRRHLPDPPELQILVPGARAHHVPSRPDAAEQHPRVVGVPDLCDALHARVRVHHDRVRRVSVRREKLLPMGRPLDGGDLGGCAQCVQPGAGGAVPDVDGGIVGPATGSEEGGLPGTPCDCLRSV